MLSSPSASALANPLMALPPYATTTLSSLQALYSDFSRQRHSNPTSYHANIEWWRKALEVIVSSSMQQHQNDATGSSRLVLHAGRGLMECTKVDRVGKPLALGSVIVRAVKLSSRDPNDQITCTSKSELRTLKTVVPVSDFINAKVSIYDPGWLPARIAAFVVGKPLWWALEQIGIVGEEGLLSSATRNSHKDTGWWGDYVFVSLVERAGEAVLDKQRATPGGPGDVLYTWDNFRETFSSAVGEEALLWEMDAKVLVKYLERDQGVLVVDQDVSAHFLEIVYLCDVFIFSKVIKFIDKDAPVEERPITAVDRGILELKTAVKSLQAQVDGLQLKINEYEVFPCTCAFSYQILRPRCTRKASVALQQKYKPVALSQIRSRKQYQDLLEKRLNSLSTLEATLISVETAAGDVEVFWVLPQNIVSF